VPSFFTANEKLPPAAMAFTFARPGTWIGVSESATFEPLPNCAQLFAPQTQTVPSDLRASECTAPAEIAVMFDSPGICEAVT
jgi:hypothetical protein